MQDRIQEYRATVVLTIHWAVRLDEEQSDSLRLQMWSFPSTQALLGKITPRRLVHT
jgi:hypothetical protein